jgi:spermidine synthase
LTRPWQTLGREHTAWGEIELRQRGETDFLLTLDGRVVMTSSAHRSERVLAELATSQLRETRSPRVLVAGLGLGYTLRAALDGLGPEAEVVVAELLSPVVKWCRGPLASLSNDALRDPRVRVVVGDVQREIEAAAGGARFDAIVLDLFEGPRGEDDPVLGLHALKRIGRALARGGVLAVWSEKPEPGFERALGRSGFDFECQRAGRGGLRHAVYRARLRGSRGAGQ